MSLLINAEMKARLDEMRGGGVGGEGGGGVLAVNLHTAAQIVQILISGASY